MCPQTVTAEDKLKDGPSAPAARVATDTDGSAEKVVREEDRDTPGIAGNGEPNKPIERRKLLEARRC